MNNLSSFLSIMANHIFCDNMKFQKNHTTIFLTHQDLKLDNNQIQNRLLSDFLTEFPEGLDGVNNNLAGKTFIFYNNSFKIMLRFINKRNLILSKIHFQDNKSKGARKIFFVVL